MVIKVDTSKGALTRMRSKRSKDQKQDKAIRLLKKKVKLNAPETQYYDAPINSITADWTSGNLFNLNQVPQDDTDTGRTGDKLTMFNLDFRGDVSMNLSGFSNRQVIRMKIIYVPKQNFAGGANQFFQAMTTARTPFFGPNYDVKQQFMIIADKLFVLDNLHPVKQFRIKKSLKGKTTGFVGATTTFAYGALILVIVTGNNNVDPPTIDGVCRLSYQG